MLTAPEMTVLVGGNASRANVGRTRTGCRHRPKTLTNDFREPAGTWAWSGSPPRRPNRVRRPGSRHGPIRRTATTVDQVFGSNSQLRGIAEAHVSDDWQEEFVLYFVAAWDKVMSLDRFDLR